MNEAASSTHTIRQAAGSWQDATAVGLRRAARVHAVATGVALGLAAVPLVAFFAANSSANEVVWLVRWASITGFLGVAAGGAIETLTRSGSDRARDRGVLLHRVALALAGLLALGLSLQSRRRGGPEVLLAFSIAAPLAASFTLPLVMRLRLTGRSLGEQMVYASSGSVLVGAPLACVSLAIISSSGHAFTVSPLFGSLWAGVFMGGVAIASIGAFAGLILPLALRRADRAMGAVSG
jgi:hypothetical protein